MISSGASAAVTEQPVHSVSEPATVLPIIQRRQTDDGVIDTVIPEVSDAAHVKVPEVWNTPPLAEDNVAGADTMQPVGTGPTKHKGTEHTLVFTLVFLCFKGT